MSIFTNKDTPYNLLELGFDRSLIRVGTVASTSNVVEDVVPELRNVFSGGIAPKSLISGELVSVLEQQAGVIFSGKTIFDNSESGYRLGIDSNNLVKFYIGNTTDYFYWNGSTIGISSNTGDALVLDYGANILLKEGGSIKFTSVSAAGPCTATLIATATGNVDNGTHSYKVTYVNSTGETSLGVISNAVTVDASNKKVDLSAIPISTSGGVTARNIYRTKAGGGDYFILTTINDNTTTIYTDNIADASLSGGIANFKENDSFGKIIIDDIESLSLGPDNTFIGQSSGLQNTTGYVNVAAGNLTLYFNTTGYSNTAIGYQSLYRNDVGYLNTGVGYQTFYYNTSGSWNTAVGVYALYANTTGIYNTANGVYSLLSNTIGRFNTGNGVNTLRANTEGYYNTANGFNAIYSNTTGYYNVGIGGLALYSNSTGSSNVALGYYAGAYETGSNAFYVDNQNRTNTAGDKAKALLYGVFAAAAANQKLTINGLLNQSVSKTPASAAATGTTGDIAWDASYIYVCTATDTWKRVGIATW